MLTNFEQFPGYWVEEDSHEVQTADLSEISRKPLEISRLKPDPRYVTSGRANAEGIAVLYCASDIKTALLEVRAPAGSACTVAECVNTRELNLADLREVKSASSWNTLKQAKQCLKNEIASMFSQRIVGSSAIRHYRLTQHISEHLRERSYDGIIFSSSQGLGWNYAFFDIDLLNIKEREMVEIESVDLKYQALPEKTFSVDGKDY